MHMHMHMHMHMYVCMCMVCGHGKCVVYTCTCVSEQARLARLFLSGLAWLDDSVGGVLAALDRHSGYSTSMYACVHV